MRVLSLLTGSLLFWHSFLKRNYWYLRDGGVYWARLALCCLYSARDSNYPGLFVFVTYCSWFELFSGELNLWISLSCWPVHL